MTGFTGRSASPFGGARALPDVPPVWRAILDARIANLDREKRRADERTVWVDDLRAHLAAVVRSVMLTDELADRVAAAFDVPVDLVRGDVVDPRQALVELAAAATAWIDAMDLAGPVE